MFRPVSIVVLIFLIISGIGSCNNEMKKDLSLTVEEYRKLGMPDQSKVWTNDDYINANITLSSLKANYPLSLPRKDSKKSGAVFNRLVSEENLSFIYDTIYPLRIRAYLIQHFTGFQSELLQFYSAEIKGEKPYMAELADINLFSLTVHEKMLELAWKIMDSDDESDQSIASGMNAVKYNYLKLISRLLEEQIKEKEYNENDLQRLSDRLSVSIIKNNTWFPPEDRKTLISHLESIINNSPGDYIKKKYIETLKIINNVNN